MDESNGPPMSCVPTHLGDLPIPQAFDVEGGIFLESGYYSKRGGKTMTGTQDTNLPVSRGEMAGMLGMAEGDPVLLLPHGQDPAPAPPRQLLLLHRRRGAADFRVVGGEEEARLQAGGGTDERSRPLSDPRKPASQPGRSRLAQGFNTKGTFYEMHLT